MSDPVFQHRIDDEGEPLHRCPKCSREFPCWLVCGCDAAYSELPCTICYAQEGDEPEPEDAPSPQPKVPEPVPA